MGIRMQLTSLFRSPGDREQDRQPGIVEQGRAGSPAEEANRRETQRLAGMSDEDREWEQAALQRHRNAQDRLMS
ncbi:MAG: hypothetical protein M3Z20_16685 [Chloroflexota bacterium]|nr:hypothetical protein [Chloroflexota bacterium]